VRMARVWVVMLLPLVMGDQAGHHPPGHTADTAGYPAVQSSNSAYPVSQSSSSAGYPAVQATDGAYTPELYQEGAYGQEGAYASADYAQATANGYYDPASSYSNYYDYSLEQNEIDEASDKQGIPNPAAFIPFFASFSLPLGAAILTFSAIVIVSAAFFLFPSEVEVEVNGTGRRRRRAIAGGLAPGPGPAHRLCGDSDSILCRVLDTVLVSSECVEAASCEVAALARSPNFPVMNRIVAPFLSSKYYDRFTSVDCSKIRCSLRDL